MRKCKTVSFDLTDAYEKELLKHAESKHKFSKYIKRLIDKDKNGAPIGGAPEPIKTEIEQESKPKPDKKAMQSYF